MQIEDSQFEIFVVSIAVGVPSYSRPLPADRSIRGEMVMKKASVISVVMSLSTLCLGYCSADLSNDGIVNFEDLSLFAMQWLTPPEEPNSIAAVRSALGIGGGTATYVVAPYNTSEEMKNRADYVCDGTLADEVQINAAIIAAAESGGRILGNVGTGGKVLLLAGSYNISAPIVMLSRVDLIGQGNLHTVGIGGKPDCGHGIYFQAKDRTNSDIGVDEKGQFRIANITIDISQTQSTPSWAIYLDTDGISTIYDCIFENIYVGGAKDGGMYVRAAWASHFYSCTFERVGDGPGLFEEATRNSVHVGTFCADNKGDGLILGGSKTTMNTGKNLAFYGCGFYRNGDAAHAGSGVVVTSDLVQYVTFDGCWADDNYNSGFLVDRGSNITFNSCLAIRNNREKVWGNAGFSLDGSRHVLKGCVSYENDGPSAETEDNFGSGYFILGGEITLSDCWSNLNHYGVSIGDSCSLLRCDVHFVGDDTQEFKHLLGAQYSIGRTYVDTYRNVTETSTDGIKAGITDTIPVTSFDGQPIAPRNLLVTGDASADGVVYVEGITADGKVLDQAYCAEQIVVGAGATVKGNIAWAKITKITRTTANGSIDVGWGDRIGLTNVIRRSSDVYKFVKNGTDTAVPTVDAVYGTVDCAPIPANAELVFFYKGL